MHKPLKTYIGNKFFVIFLLITGAVLGGLQFVQWQKRAAIEREVAGLSAEAVELSARNQEIAESLEFLHSQSAKERIARQQLNMKKDGEIVVSFQYPVKIESPDSKKTQASNPQKWWNYFFSEKSF